MGIAAAGLHLPVHRLPDKELSGIDGGRGFDALRVPWWDEDPLTLAIEAALTLPGDRLDGVQALYLALDAPSDQPGLAALALDLDVPVHEATGPDAGLQALIDADPDRPALVLSGGQTTGSAGVALVLAPEEGVEVTGRAGAAAGPLSARPSGVLARVLDALDGEGPLALPPGRLERKARVDAELHDGLSRQVGDAGAAGALLDLVHHLAEADGPRRVASLSRGQTIAASLGPGRIPAHGLDAPAHGTTAAAWRAMREHEPVAWHEASQGAYVSLAEYEADPRERYGARAKGPGEVVAVTTIQAGPPGEFLVQHGAAGPYDVAILDLDAGQRVIGQVAGPPGQLAIGDRVVPVVRRLFEMEGAWRYAVKWKAA